MDMRREHRLGLGAKIVVLIVLAVLARFLGPILHEHPQFEIGLIVGFTACACYARWRYGFWPLN